MTWTMSSGLCSNFRKIAVAGVLIAGPMAALSVPAYAAPSLGGAPAVFTAPLPADPPPPPPPAPPVQQSTGEYYNPNDADDWWAYSGTGSF